MLDASCSEKVTNGSTSCTVDMAENVSVAGFLEQSINIVTIQGAWTADVSSRTALKLHPRAATFAYKRCFDVCRFINCSCVARLTPMLN